MINCPHYITDRYHPLPPTYIPADLIRSAVPFIAPISDLKRCVSMEMYEPLLKLFRACLEDGLSLMGVSAYRSYERQKEIYDSSIMNRGKTYTNSHIAFPGTSEHQTGLAIDVSCSSIDYELCEDFEYTAEGVWLKKNAGRFGFVFSFTKENAQYTGYVNEPWHIRYACKGTKYFSDEFLQ